MRQPGMVGLAVGTVDGGQVRFLKGYGEALAGSGMALRVGLVSRVVEPQRGNAEARAAALSLAAKPGDALVLTKRLLKADLRQLPSPVADEFTELARRLSSPEARAVLKLLLSGPVRCRPGQDAGQEKA